MSEFESEMKQLFEGSNIVKQKRLDRPSVYCVIFWNADGTKEVKREVYPMHIFTLKDVVEKLKGREAECDIYESRYFKQHGQYIANGRTFVWNGYIWVVQP